jgi:hypothetical protein
VDVQKNILDVEITQMMIGKDTNHKKSINEKQAEAATQFFTIGEKNESSKSLTTIIKGKVWKSSIGRGSHSGGVRTTVLLFLSTFELHRY